MTPKRYGDRWEGVGDVGEGGQAHVYKVKDTRGQHPGFWCLKRLKDKNRIERFMREVEAVRKVSHRGIARAIDVNLEGDKPFYVSAYYDRGSIVKADVHSWSIEDRLVFFKQILEVMAAVHRHGIVHRDLKPQNILVDDSGCAVVADFGICYFEAGERHTLTDEAVGARQYTAPELEDGRLDDVLPVSDVYSLGKLLYWICSNRTPPRVSHRDEVRNLVNVTGDSRYEHINCALDRMLIGVLDARLSDASEALEAFERAHQDFLAKPADTDDATVEDRRNAFANVLHLDSDQPGVRVAAAEELGVTGSNSPELVIPRLLFALGDRENEVRRAARDALIRVGDKTLPYSVNTLEASDSSLLQRVGVCEVLGALLKTGPDSETMLNTLEAAQSDSSEDVRMAAGLALYNKGWYVRLSGATLIEMVINRKWEVEGARVSTGNRMVAVLQTRAGDPERLSDFVRALGHPNSEVRRQAVSFLRSFGANARTALKTATEDKDATVRSAAHDLLAQMGGED